MKILTSFSVLNIMFLLLPNTGLAQPTLEGDISGILTQGSYIVTGNCTIPSGETLTIQPGTTLLFSGQYGIYVYGTLLSEGTESDSIVFTRQFPTWDCIHSGIRFQEVSHDNLLSYCLIEHSDNQLEPLLFGGGIFCSGTDLDLSHSRIRNCFAYDGGGLYAESSTIVISDCIFDSLFSVINGGAIYVFESSCEVIGSKIFSNRSGSGGGIYFENSDVTSIEECEIYQNEAANG